MKKKPKYTLLDGVEQNKLHPQTFEIPTQEEKQKDIKVGTFVKLCFQKTITTQSHNLNFTKFSSSFNSERMWVEVTDIDGDNLSGTVANDPVVIDGLKFDDKIAFEYKHIISILNQK